MMHWQAVWIRNPCCHSYNTSFDRLEQLLLVIDYLCSSRRRTEPLCCHWLRLALQCGRRAGFLRSQGEATSPGNGRCRQPANPEHNCPGQPSTPGTAAPLWPAAPQGTRSGLRLRTETVCQELRSETPHLQTRKQITPSQDVWAAYYHIILVAWRQKYKNILSLMLHQSAKIRV